MDESLFNSNKENVNTLFAWIDFHLSNWKDYDRLTQNHRLIESYSSAVSSNSERNSGNCGLIAWLDDLPPFGWLAADPIYSMAIFLAKRLQFESLWLLCEKLLNKNLHVLKLTKMVKDSPISEHGVWFSQLTPDTNHLTADKNSSTNQWNYRNHWTGPPESCWTTTPSAWFACDSDFLGSLWWLAT